MPPGHLWAAPSTGIAFSGISLPFAASMNSTLKPDMAAPKVMASRRSLRDLRLMTNIFWNYDEERRTMMLANKKQQQLA
jgi:hypothetical protein